MKETGRSSLPPLSVFLGAGVVPRDSREDNHNQLGEDLGKYLVVRPGDIVFNKLRTWQGGLGASNYEGIVSPAYFVCRPSVEYDSRFLQFLLLSDTYLQELTRVSKWQPPSQFDIGWEQLRAVPIIAPSIAVQRAIADYLDAETARIDALIAKKQRMIELCEDRVESLIAEVLESLVDRWGEAPLKSVAGLDVSNIDKKSYDGQQMVRLCNYTDVYYNRKITSELDFMVATADPGQIRRLTLQLGDVLITKDSETADDIAVPAWVAEDLGGVVLGYHLALLRPHEGDGRFLYWAIRSRRCRDAFSLAASGVTRVGLRRDEMARVRVPVPPMDVQRTAAELIERQAAAQDSAINAIKRQIELLREHRRALITAAVTGELEVPGVAA